MYVVESCSGMVWFVVYGGLEKQTCVNFGSNSSKTREQKLCKSRGSGDGIA